ncbi:protein roadkill-like [Battus philenor]|uniref:protein roadkill-like n=1 Tax=Battus philenor TaxID=42288 RepID=UPI0035CEA2EF
MLSNDVSPLNKCETAKAKSLSVFDIGNKLKTEGHYSIGGTYFEGESDLWFYYSTSVCPGHQYLLDLFVCHRRPGIISVGVSNSSDLTHRENVNGITCSLLPKSLTWKLLKANEANENSFIKTFCFSIDDVVKMKNNTLCIALSIDMKPKELVLDDIINRVKLQHNFSDINNDKKDYELVSSSGKIYKIHKIILATHSNVFRSMLKEEKRKKDSMVINMSDNDLELLIEYLYTGTIKNLVKQNCQQLLDIADMFQLKKLFLLIECAINNQLSVENAVDFALLSERYKLSNVQTNIFKFIKEHPQVFKSEAWMGLNNVSLTKKLLEFSVESDES